MPVGSKLTGNLKARKDTAATPAVTASSLDRQRARSPVNLVKTDKKATPLPRKDVKQPTQAPPNPLKEKQPAQVPPSPSKEKANFQIPSKDRQPAQLAPSLDNNKQLVKDTKKVIKRPSVMNLTKLTKDGRRKPEYFRKIVQEASSPSKISIAECTEFYQPGDDFINTEDVYTYRGYKKISKLDEGAFGAVYKGLRVGDKLTVAIKEIDMSRRTHKRHEEMRRELFVLQKIDSPYVVKLIEHFVWYNTCAIIMEFCQGSNVTSYLKDDPLPEARSKSWFRQMCLGIRTLHRIGISHRDIKLNNFLVDGNKEQIKVADFGLSIVSYKPRYGMKICRSFCGTEPYMAPEIIHRSSKGYRHYNPYSGDVWALGVCLYAMTTRTFPFKQQTDLEALYKLQRERKWRIPKNYREAAGEDCCDLIYHMLDPDPDRRISLNGALSHPWLNSDLVVLSKEDSKRS